MSKHLIFAIFITMVCAGSLAWLYPAVKDYNSAKRDYYDIERKHINDQTKNEELSKEIYRLQTSDKAVEHVARDKFGWCKIRETVYDFSDEK
ncbi:MAG: septum formation initiator family protein [Lentisphaeria bacterium]|nr:septum formation initiator family protein [Lentisphaeria bacterium]NQZ67588.1 septum formation initiator family protein [Lentisphaeria bacterium]